LKRFIEVIDARFSLSVATQCYRLDRDDLINLEPEIKKLHDAYYFPDEAHLDTQAIMNQLSKYLYEKNVKWHKNTMVDEIDLQKIHVGSTTTSFDFVIDCRGLGAKNVFNQLQGIRGELIWLHAPDVNIARPIRLLHPRYSLYIVPRPKNVYLVGASEIHSEDYSEISVRSILELLTAAFYLHPGFAEARILQTVTSCRPTLPDYLPRIKYRDGFVAVNGLYRHGFLIAPMLANEVLRFIEQGRSALHYPQIGEFL